MSNQDFVDAIPISFQSQGKSYSNWIDKYAKIYNPELVGYPYNVVGWKPKSGLDPEL